MKRDVIKESNARADELKKALNGEDHASIAGKLDALMSNLNGSFNKGLLAEDDYLMAASQLHAMVVKAQIHKYIRREGSPGKYTYIYQEPGVGGGSRGAQVSSSMMTHQGKSLDELKKLHGEQAAKLSNPGDMNAHEHANLATEHYGVSQLIADKESDKKSGEPIGKTDSGKDIHAQFDHKAHADFTKQDHVDAASRHADELTKLNSEGGLGKEAFAHHITQMRKHADAVKSAPDAAKKEESKKKKDAPPESIPLKDKEAYNEIRAWGGTDITDEEIEDFAGVFTSAGLDDSTLAYKKTPKSEEDESDTVLIMSNDIVDRVVDQGLEASEKDRQLMQDIAVGMIRAHNNGTEIVGMKNYTTKSLRLASIISRKNDDQLVKGVQEMLGQPDANGYRNARLFVKQWAEVKPALKVYCEANKVVAAQCITDAAAIKKAIVDACCMEPDSSDGRRYTWQAKGVAEQKCSPEIAPAMEQYNSKLEAADCAMRECVVTEAALRNMSDDDAVYLKAEELAQLGI